MFFFLFQTNIFKLLIQIILKTIIIIFSKTPIIHSVDDMFLFEANITNYITITVSKNTKGYDKST